MDRHILSELLDLSNQNRMYWGAGNLTARHSGKVLNVSGVSTADGANIDQWSWANVNQQQFQIASVP